MWMDTTFETQLEKLSTPWHVRMRHSFKYFAAITRARFIAPFEERKRGLTLLYALIVPGYLLLTASIGWAYGWQEAAAFAIAFVPTCIAVSFVALALAWSFTPDMSYTTTNIRSRCDSIASAKARCPASGWLTISTKIHSKCPRPM